MKIKNFILLFIVIFIIYSCSSGGQTPLHKAAYNGDFETVKNIILKKPNIINKQDRYGYTALIYASMIGNNEMVTFLLDSGADPNIRSKKIPPAFDTTGTILETSAIKEAIRNNHDKTASILLGYRINIDFSAFILASEKGKLELVKKMLSVNRELEENINKTGSSSIYPSPLCAASRSGNLELVIFFVEDKKAAVNKKCFNQTALSEAVIEGNNHIVSYLLKEGANPNLILDKSGLTPFYYSLVSRIKSPEKEECSKRVDIVKKLIKYGADINYQFYDNFSVRKVAKQQLDSSLSSLNSLTDDDKKVKHNLTRIVQCRKEIFRVINNWVKSKK